MEIIKSFFETKDKARIFYTECGEGRPIVFTHGFKCSSRFFDSTRDTFSKNYRVITMDFRGHGNSSKVLHGHTIENYANDINELLDYLKIKNACMVGWSMGGSAVLAYHIKNKTKHISSIVLIDNTLSPYSNYEWNKHPLNNSNIDLTQKIVIQCDLDHSVYCDSFAQKIWNMKCTEEEKLWVKEELLKTPGYISMAIYTDFVHTDGAKMLEKVTVPVLLFGSDSVVSSNGASCASRHYPEFLPESIKRETCIIENGTHIPFITNAEVFNKTLFNFLEKY